MCGDEGDEHPLATVMGRKETCISDISQEVPIELIPRASIVGPTGVSKCVSYTDTILRFTRTHFVR